MWPICKICGYPIPPPNQAIGYAGPVCIGVHHASSPATPQFPYAPPHGWTCFHCGETFMTVGGARDHFGAEPSATPGCMLHVQLGEERGLLMALRKVEERNAELLSDLHNESSLSKALYPAIESAIKSFKPFRECRTLQDVFNVYDIMEGRALAAEERLLAQNEGEQS